MVDSRRRAEVSQEDIVAGGHVGVVVPEQGLSEHATNVRKRQGEAAGTLPGNGGGVVVALLLVVVALLVVVIALVFLVSDLPCPKGGTIIVLFDCSVCFK